MHVTHAARVCCTYAAVRLGLMVVFKLCAAFRQTAALAISLEGSALQREEEDPPALLPQKTPLWIGQQVGSQCINAHVIMYWGVASIAAAASPYIL